MTAPAHARRQISERRVAIQVCWQQQTFQALFKCRIELYDIPQQVVLKENRLERRIIEIRQERREEFHSGIAMHGVQVYRDTGGALIIARIYQACRNFAQPRFAARKYTMVARQDLVQIVMFPMAMFPNHDGRKKSISLDGFTERLVLFFIEILRITPQGDQRAEADSYQCDTGRFHESTQTSSIPSNHPHARSIAALARGVPGLA